MSRALVSIKALYILAESWPSGLEKEADELLADSDKRDKTLQQLAWLIPRLSSTLF